jgi:hypothetical protein
MYFGWDISTSIIGLVAFDASHKFVWARCIDLRKVDIDLLKKADVVSQFIIDLVEEIGVDFYEGTHIVEDKLSSFSFGHTQQQTLMKLASFNTVVSWIIWNTLHEHDPQKGRMRPGSINYIHPSTVKAIMRQQGLLIPKGGDKKRLTLEYVRKIQPDFPYAETKNGNPQPYCFDKADAYVTGKAGIIAPEKCRRVEKSGQ